MGKSEIGFGIEPRRLLFGFVIEEGDAQISFAIRLIFDGWRIMSIFIQRCDLGPPQQVKVAGDMVTKFTTDGEIKATANFVTKFLR